MRKRWLFADHDFPCRFGRDWCGRDAVDGYRARHIGLSTRAITPTGRGGLPAPPTSLGNLARRSIGRAFPALQ